MGRPLNKKYFGNYNTGSDSVSSDDGIGGQGVDSVTISTAGSNYSQGVTATVSAPVALDVAAVMLVIARLPYHALAVVKTLP